MILHLPEKIEKMLENYPQYAPLILTVFEKGYSSNEALSAIEQGLKNTISHWDMEISKSADSAYVSAKYTAECRLKIIEEGGTFDEYVESFHQTDWRVHLTD